MRRIRYLISTDVCKNIHNINVMKPIYELRVRFDFIWVCVNKQQSYFNDIFGPF